MHTLRFVFVFVLGLLVAWAGISFVIRSYNPNVLSATTIQTDGSNFISRFLYDNLLPQVANSRALAPIFETKRSVEESVEAVSTLPEAQKQAVCEELCGSSSR